MSERWERWQSAFDEPAVEPSRTMPKPRRRARLSGFRLPATSAPNVWEGFDRRERRLVRRAVRNGELLRDPAEAALVVRVARRTQRVAQPGRRIAATVARFALTAWFVAEALVTLSGQLGRGIPTAAALVPLLWLSVDIASLVRWRKFPEQMRRAGEAHLRYLEGVGAPVPADEDWHPSPGARGRDDGASTPRELWVGTGLLAASIFTIALIVASLPAHGMPLVYRLASALSCLVGLVFAVVAAAFARRGWKATKGRLRHAEAGLLFVMAVGAAIGWLVGLVAVAAA